MLSGTWVTHRAGRFLFILLTILLTLQTSPGVVGEIARAGAVQVAIESFSSQENETTEVDAADDPVAIVIAELAVQLFTFAGWEVTESQVDLNEPATPTESGLLSGSGSWSVLAAPENGEPLSLTGVFTFQMEGVLTRSNMDRRPQDIFGAFHLTGSLSGDQTGITIQADQFAERTESHSNSDLLLRIVIEQSEVVRTHEVRASTATYATGAGSYQTDTSVSIVSGSNTWQMSQTDRAFDLGQGISEHWVVGTQGSSESGPDQISVDQHHFEYDSDAEIAAYIDRLDVRTGESEFQLARPGTVSATSGSAFVTDIELVPVGEVSVKPLSGTWLPSSNLSTGPEPRPVSPIHPSCSGAAWFGSTAAGAGLDALTEGLGNLDWGGAEWFGKAPVNIGGLGQAGSVGVGVLVAILAKAIAEALGVTDPLEQAGISYGIGLVAALLTGGLAGLAFGITTGIWSELLGAGIESLLNSLCHSDPYFQLPDIRPAVVEPSGSKVDMLLVSGGLPQAPNSESDFTTPDSGATATELLLNEDQNYFVGGAVPEGAEAIGFWEWDSNRMFGAIPAHTQPKDPGFQQHYFINPDNPLSPGPDDFIIQYVYLDPVSLPDQLLLQFYVGDGDGEHRALWGDNLAQTGGVAGMESLFPMGSLPSGGQWVRLKIPARSVGVDGESITGMLFGNYGGQVWWGPTTTSNRLTDTSPNMMVMDEQQQLPEFDTGAQIALWLREQSTVTLDIVDTENGEPVRTLISGELLDAGFKVMRWDGALDNGSRAEDGRYAYRLTLDGEVVAEGEVRLRPLFAELFSPTDLALVRGSNLPIAGRAYGDGFTHYILEYGAGLEPDEWIQFNYNHSPTVYQSSNQRIRGNLGTWDVGVDEYGLFRSRFPDGLSGVFTVRLTVYADDGSVAIDSVSVVVGRLATTAFGGSITSPDGLAELQIDPFSVDVLTLHALVPLSDLEPDGEWEAVLPTNADLAGPLYEVFPANAIFSNYVTLELPIAAEMVNSQPGILLGDGTPDGWRYLGGVVDAERGVISVSLSGFGGSRAIVAAFVSESFQVFPVHPGVYQEPVSAGESETLLVTSESHPVAYFADFESSLSGWQPGSGTTLELVTGGDAGLVEGDTAIKVSRTGSIPRVVKIPISPIDVNEFPILTFDYRLTASASFNILVRSDGRWWQLDLSGSGNYFGLSGFGQFNAPQPLESDGKWHSYQLDLLAALRYLRPNTSIFTVDEIVLGVIENVATNLDSLVDPGGVGDAHFIDNFAILRPSNVSEISLSWQVDSGTDTGSYAYSFAPASAADGVEQTATGSAQVALVVNGDEPDGLWLAAISVLNDEGKEVSSAHYPVLIDRTSPVWGVPAPVPGGAGTSSFLTMPIADTGGVDLSGLVLVIDGTEYGTEEGITFNPAVNTLNVTTFALNPRLEAAPGTVISVQVSGVSDYAGNVPVESLSWSFTSEIPWEASAEFAPLAGISASAPALSPDGELVAFVQEGNDATGIWIAPVASDTVSEAESVPLDTTSWDQADPAWSPDGEKIAYVANGGSGLQLWIAAPDGTGAQALTPPTASLASPAWSSDSSSLAFISDGNVWRVQVDGTGLIALTREIERPYRSVSWQPGGQLLALHFSLYEDAIRLLDLTTGEITPLTSNGWDHSPAWLDSSTVLFAAPAEPGLPDAIWMINLDGSGLQIFEGSGLPGVADTDASVSADGSTLAIVSTRSGEVGIWISAPVRIGSLDVPDDQPVTPGEDVSLELDVTTDSSVTVELIPADGGSNIVFFENLMLSEGANTISIAPNLPDGTVLQPGTYVIRVVAEGVDGERMEQVTTLTIVEEEETGSLVIPVELWPGQPADAVDALHVLVFTAGNRTQPVVEYTGGELELAAGDYIVTVSYGTQRIEVPVTVNPDSVTEARVDLGLSEIRLDLSCASDAGLLDTAVITLSQSDGETVATALGASAEFLLSPDDYDIVVSAGDRNWKLDPGELSVGDQILLQQELCMGSLRLEVATSTGQPADEVSVYVFEQGSTDPVQTESGNPVELLLPEGTYDVRLDYENAETGLIHRHWIHAVEITNGEVREIQFDLGLGTLIIELSGDALSLADSILVFRAGDRAAPLATIRDQGSTTLELDAGPYDVVAMLGMNEVGVATVEVRAGEETIHVVNLGDGTLLVDLLLDDNAVLSEIGGTVSILVYPVSAEETRAPLDIVFEEIPLEFASEVPATIALPDGWYVVEVDASLPDGGFVYEISAPLHVQSGSQTDFVVDARTGSIVVMVSGLEDMPAGGRVEIELVSTDPNDWLGGLFVENGVEQRVVAGEYDIRVTYCGPQPDSPGFEDCSEDVWIESVLVEPGESVEIEVELDVDAGAGS